jgi:hypothetical protein
VKTPAPMNETLPVSEGDTPPEDQIQGMATDDDLADAARDEQGEH